MKHIIMKKNISTIAVTILSAFCLCNAQTVKTHVVEDGGTGPFKAEIVADESLPAFTIYRPQNIRDVVAEHGRLPIVLYGNGGCANNNIEMRLLLSEIASYGYIVVAIGPYDEEDPVERWKDVLKTMYPTGKKVVLANGEELKELTDEEKEQHMKEMADENSREKAQSYFGTYSRQLLEAMDWVTDRNADQSSEYYHCADLRNVAVMGQSCGGAQALAVSHDPRISTAIILNSGIGDMSMQGATKSQLANIEIPMLYIAGGPSDVAFNNAKLDFQRLQGVPVVLINTPDGHSGTFYETNGGKYASAVRRWLDWKLKDKDSEADIFTNEKSLMEFEPTWSSVSKNL